MQHDAVQTRGKRVCAGFVAAILATTLMVPSLAFADPSSSEKQAEAQAALASLNSMQATLDQAAVNYDEALAAQTEAEANRDAAQARINEASDQIADLQDRLGIRARGMYRAGNSTFLDMILGATTFETLVTNWDVLNQINENDAELVQQTKDLRAEVQEQETVYAEESRVATEKADEAKRMQDEAAATIASMQATYDSLSAEAAALLEQERAAQQAAEAARAQSVVQNSVQQATGGQATGDAGNTDSGETYQPSTPSAPAPSYDAYVGGSVVERAYSQIGKAYGYDDPSYGAGPTAFDCSGFVAFCLSGSYSRMGSTLTFMNWPIASDPQPGDVCVNAGHCGIYIGGGQMIHAATYGVGVTTGPVQAGMIIVRP